MSEKSVGTVHKFQGAESPVIIFSSVYTKQTDGVFIDASASMLNVAVSRAKDHFIVFGDIDVFAMHEGKSTPRGLLASRLFKHDSNEITSPEISRLIHLNLAMQVMGEENEENIDQLINYEAHDAFILEQLSLAKDRVVIISPWLVRKNFVKAGIDQAINEAVSRSVKVYVGYDPDKIESKDIDSIETLKSLGASVAGRRNIHCKIVARDNSVCCIGSYNWLSASRDPNYAKSEISSVIKGDTKNVKEHIEKVLESIKQYRN